MLEFLDVVAVLMVVMVVVVVVMVMVTVTVAVPMSMAVVASVVVVLVGNQERQLFSQMAPTCLSRLHLARLFWNQVLTCDNTLRTAVD